MGAVQFVIMSTYCVFSQLSAAFYCSLLCQNDVHLTFHSQCAINFSSESIPNGIGFGGKVNHLGLFLSANFDQGHTFECTTYSSPCLSKSSRIYPEVIECWGVARQKIEQDRTDAHRGTVLERFKEDRHMLNMVGLANSSE